MDAEVHTAPDLWCPPAVAGLVAGDGHCETGVEVALGRDEGFWGELLPEGRAPRSVEDRSRV